jgi:thioredoxin 1
MSNVIHLNTAAFPKTRESGKPVLIDFWAPWCGPCKMQNPILDQVSAQLGDRAIIAKVNVDEEPDLAVTFAVQSIPTLVVLKGDGVLRRMVGVQQAATLVGALEAAGA